MLNKMANSQSNQVHEEIEVLGNTSQGVGIGSGNAYAHISEQGSKDLKNNLGYLSQCSLSHCSFIQSGGLD